MKIVIEITSKRTSITVLDDSIASLPRIAHTGERVMPRLWPNVQRTMLIRFSPKEHGNEQT